MSKILLNDLLNLSKEEIENTKIKFNMNDGSSEPMDEYLDNPEKVNSSWFLWKGKRGDRLYSVGQTAICLVRLAHDNRDAWLLTTIKKITKDLDVKEGPGYEAEEIEEYEKYFARVIVKFHNDTRTVIRDYKNVCDDLEVYEILPEKYNGKIF